LGSYVGALLLTIIGGTNDTGKNCICHNDFIAQPGVLLGDKWDSLITRALLIIERSWFHQILAILSACCENEVPYNFWLLPFRQASALASVLNGMAKRSS